MENDQILKSLFQLFSSTCVYNPFEVIVVLISLCISFSLISSPSSLILNKTVNSATKQFKLVTQLDNNDLYDDNNNNKLEQKFNTDHSPLHLTLDQKEIKIMFYDFNFSFVMVLRCLAFTCIFLQFKTMKRIHSKFILLTSILITLVSTVLFNNALINWYNLETPNNLLLIIDISIYALIAIDFKKCNLILNNALELNSLREAKTNIVINFAHYASKSSLDTFFLILFMALGNLSDSKEIKSFSLFSCMLLASNFLIFITVYPALLSLILQFKKKNPIKKSSFLLTRTNSESHSNQSTILSSNVSSKELSEKPEFNSLSNPVLVYVKILMTIFLVIIHLKSKIFNKKLENFEENNENLSKQIDDAENQNELIIFYTKCCLLLTSLVFVLTKFYTRNFWLSQCGTHTKKIGKTFSNSSVQTHEQSNKQVTTDFKLTQTDSIFIETIKDTDFSTTYATPCRSVEECLEFIKGKKSNIFLDDFQDQEILQLVSLKHIPIYKLESYFSNPTRGIYLRRKIIESKFAENSLVHIPFENYNYKKVIGSCCENIIGYVPIPLGTAGPLLIDGKHYYIPMATTEGTLVASTNRGCSALTSSSGVFTKVISDGMTRGPVLRFQSAMKAVEAKDWADKKENFEMLKNAFDSTSQFARLESIKCCVASRYLFVRFRSTTGDAMGMNMLSKGCEKALAEFQKQFPDSDLMSLSGNYCTDKKPSAMNWIEGRGKSVVCEAVVKGEIVKSVLKTSVKSLCDLNLTKNLLGSAMAGSIGGFNAHASNIVTAIFIACGQDPAQVVESSNCLTWMESTGTNNDDLYISCTMPSLEVGTVGGGTGLEAQSSCLKILGIQGSNTDQPGENACTLARIIAASVLAGELSLMSALASGHLVNSHMKYNRASTANAIKKLSENIHSFL